MTTSLHNYKNAEVGELSLRCYTSRRGEKILCLKWWTTSSFIFTQFWNWRGHLLPDICLFGQSFWVWQICPLSFGKVPERLLLGMICATLKFYSRHHWTTQICSPEKAIANQKTYESSLENLQLICDTYIEDLIKKSRLDGWGNILSSQMKGTKIYKSHSCKEFQLQRF